MNVDRYEFNVDAPILGYRASAARAFDPKYRGYKRRIRLLANVAGIPDELLDTDTAEVYVRIYWRKLARIDADNCFKAVVDGIWKGDRQVAAGHFTRAINTGEERIEVSVTVERR